MKQCCACKTGNPLAMTLFATPKSAAQNVMPLCDTSKSVAQSVLPLCSISKSTAQYVLPLCATSKSVAQSVFSLFATQKSNAQSVLPFCASSQGIMQFFATKRKIRGSHTLLDEAVPVPALLPRLIHFEGSKSIHPNQTNETTNTLSRGFILECAERRERHYGCGWLSNHTKMVNLTLASNCHTSEVSAVATRLVVLYQGMNFSEDTFLANAMADFIGLSERITAAIDRNVYAAYDTEDYNRSQCLRSFHHLLVGSKGSQHAVVRDSAMAIAEIFKPFGLGILRKSLDEKTGHINALLTNLGEASMQQHVANIPGMAECISQLRQAQAAFEAKRADFQSRRGIMRNSESATVLKGQIREQLNTVLIPYFQVMDSVKGGSYSEFNTTMREVVASANVTASLHRRRKKAAVIDETPAEPRQNLDEGGLSA